MFDNNYFTGAIMLETMWISRKKDLLDLISPFIHYGVARSFSINDIINIDKVLSIVKNEFGYTNMPATIVERVFKRNPNYYKRIEHQYKFIGNLDNYVTDIEKRRDECDRRLEIIGKQLSVYLNEHLSRKTITDEQSIIYLCGFFSRQGIYLGTNQLEEHENERNENDYYIAQYIYEKRDARTKEYEYIIDLVKGYFLKSAIYLQAENGSLITSNYKNVSFYYDTPFLLRLLGYKSKEDNQSAYELHNELKKQKGNFYFFTQTQREIDRILRAYQRDVGHTSKVTLEGLNEKNYSSEDVQRLRDTLINKLNGLSIKLETEIIRDNNLVHNIDNDFKLGLCSYLNQSIIWRDQESMEADLESIINIHNLRGHLQSKEIEHCKAIFVTTNIDLARLVNEYYYEELNDNCFPLIITDSDLAALTWIKCGSVGNLPEYQLLKNAYIATQPSADVLEKFGDILEKMQTEGQIDLNMAIAIRSSRFVQKELLLSSINGVEIDNNYVSNLKKKLIDEYSNDARIEEQKKAQNRFQAQQHLRLENAMKMARQYADEKKQKTIKRGHIIARIVEVILFLFAVIGLVYSIISSTPPNTILLICTIVFALISALSIIKLPSFVWQWIDSVIIKLSNKKYDKAYNQKKEEYCKLFDDNNE